VNHSSVKMIGWAVLKIAPWGTGLLNLKYSIPEGLSLSIVAIKNNLHKLTN